jgi:hypothetical protein
MRPRNESYWDPLDMYLGRLLKNWLAQQSPPAGSKARLLRAASFNPPVRRTYLALAPVLMQLMQIFRRAFINLFLNPTLQPVRCSYPTKKLYSYTAYYDLSQRLTRDATLQSLLTETGIFC